MEIRPCVVALLPVHRAHADYLPLFEEHREVAVDRAEAEVGVLRLEAVVDHFRCGVVGHGAEGFENSLTLLAVFSLNLHRVSLKQ